MLPREVKRQQQRNKRIIIALIISGLVLLIYASLFTVLTLKIAAVKNQLANEKEVLAITQSNISSLEPYQELLEQIDKVNFLYKKAMDNTPNWNDILNEIIIDLPHDIMFVELAAKKQNENNSDNENLSHQLLINGFAQQPTSISILTNNLEKLDAIKNVQVEFLQFGELGKNSGFYFSVNCTVSSFPYQFNLFEKEVFKYAE